MTANLAHPEPATAQLLRVTDEDDRRRLSLRLREDLGVTMLFADRAIEAVGLDYDQAVEWIRRRMAPRAGR